MALWGGVCYCTVGGHEDPKYGCSVYVGFLLERAER